MTNTNIAVFGLGTPNRGELNQVYGAFAALAELTGNSYDFEQMFLLPLGVSSVAEMKDAIRPSDYKNYSQFKAALFEMLDVFFAKVQTTPRVFVTAYVQAQNQFAGSNVDSICRAVKEYYKEHNLGNVFTAVLTSRLHNYKYVDLINVPKHLMTFTSRIRLLQNAKMRKKTLVTIGTINNFSQKNVKTKHKELMKKLASLKNDEKLKDIIQKFEKFVAMPKKVVVCLGGRVEGPEVNFGLPFGKKIFNDAQTLAKCGYGVVILNGPRTPNDVTDYLYEQALKTPDVIFHNCKNIAQSDEDRAPHRWRIYSGPHEDEFKVLQKLGNIYPGVLGFDNLLVAHTMDSYSSCETASAAINTAICRKGLYVDPDLRADCHNLVQLLCPKYAIDWDEFVYFSQNMKIEPKDLKPKVLSNPLRVFAETVLSKIS